MLIIVIDAAMNDTVSTLLISCCFKWIESCVNNFNVTVLSWKPLNLQPLDLACDQSLLQLQICPELSSHEQ